MTRAGIASCAALMLTACVSFPEFPETPIDTAAPRNFASDKTVSVEEFELAAKATNYPGPEEWLGVEVAQAIAEHLRRAGVRAQAVERGSEPQADIVIRGRIVKAHGGSKAARSWAPGAGGAIFGVEGEASLDDGARVAPFARERRSSRSTDSLVVIELSVDAVGRDIAQMVIANRYSLVPEE